MQATVSIIGALLVGSVFGTDGSLNARSTEQVGLEIERHVQVVLHGMRRHATVVRVDGLKADDVPKTAFELEFGAMPEVRLKRRVPLSVEYLVGGNVVKKIHVWIELREERRVLTYTRPADRHQAGEELDIGWRVIDMICCSGSVVNDSRWLAGRRTRRKVLAGEPVMLSDFEEEPEVRSFSEVSVKITRGAIELKTNGTALSDARLGERVSIQLKGAGARVRARVIAHQQVALDEN